MGDQLCEDIFNLVVDCGCIGDECTWQDQICVAEALATGEAAEQETFWNLWDCIYDICTNEGQDPYDISCQQWAAGSHCAPFYTACFPF